MSDYFIDKASKHIESANGAIAKVDRGAHGERVVSTILARLYDANRILGCFDAGHPSEEFSAFDARCRAAVTKARQRSAETAKRRYAGELIDGVSLFLDRVEAGERETLRHLGLNGPTAMLLMQMDEVKACFKAIGDDETPHDTILALEQRVSIAAVNLKMHFDHR